MNSAATAAEVPRPSAPIRHASSALALCVLIVALVVAVLAPGHAVAQNAAKPATPAGLLPVGTHPATPVHAPAPVTHAFVPTSEISPLIVGGDRANPAAWPYIAAIVINNSALCTGDRVAARWVLTARHCIDVPNTDSPVAAGTVEVNLGDHDIYSRQGWVIATAVVPYPVYDPAKAQGDLALIELPADARATQEVNLASPTQEPRLPASVWIAGWGLTATGGSTPPEALEAQTTLWSQASCASVWGMGQFIAASELCAGGPDPSSPSRVLPSGCNGDSGGPLVLSDASGPWTDELLGSTDYGSIQGCAALPTVYQRTSHYYEWIVQTTGLAPTTIHQAYVSARTPSSVSVTVWLNPFGANTAVELRNGSGHTVILKRLAGSSYLGWTTLRLNGLTSGTSYTGDHVVTSTHYGTSASTALTLTTDPTPSALRIHGLTGARVPASLSPRRTLLVPTGWRYTDQTRGATSTSEIFSNPSAPAERITIRTMGCSCNGDERAQSELRGASPFDGHPWAAARTTRGTLIADRTLLAATAMCVVMPGGRIAYLYVDAPASERAEVHRILTTFLRYH